VILLDTSVLVAAVAAAAMAHGAHLWTANIRDFSDIPDLTLFDPA
jgi:predicted nucleic acid-binding protein